MRPLLELIEPTIHLKACRDDKDNKFLELVLCQVSRLISILARRTLPVWQEQHNPSNSQPTNAVL
jgi:hypothetical protein